MPIEIESSTDSAEDVALANAPAPKVVVDPAAATGKAPVVKTNGVSAAPVVEELDPEVEQENPGEVAPKEKPSKGVQQRFDKLTKQREDERREKEYWKAKALEAKVPVAEKTLTDPKPAPVAAAGEPDPDKFESHALYLKALTRWEISQDKQASEAKASEAKTQDTQKKMINDHLDRVSKFKESNEDFDDALEAVDDIVMPPALQREIVKSDNGPQLMFELAKNRDELARICALPEDKIVRALGRFEARLEPVSEPTTEKPEPKTPKAPAPITPVGTRSTSTGKKSISDENLSQKEYERMREDQRKARMA